MSLFTGRHSGRHSGRHHDATSALRGGWVKQLLVDPFG